MSLKKLPLATLISRLGYAGLIPFLGLAALLWLVKPEVQPFVALALQGYGAMVASFLGGIHWGIGYMRGTSSPALHFWWGVVPSLGAWLAVVMPAYAGLPLLGLLMLACYLVDRRTWGDAGLAHWLPLRLRLTVVAMLACLGGAAAT